MRGLIYVPGKLLTAVVHTEAAVENEFPHQTLVLNNKWAPVISNSVLMNTCREKTKFQGLYEQMMSKEGITDQQVQMVTDIPVVVNKN